VSDPNNLQGDALARAILQHIQETERLRQAEQKKERVWRNIRAIGIVASLLAGPLILSTLANQSGLQRVTGDYVALVRVDGEIGAGKPANGNRIGSALEKAFEDKKAKGVVIAINSPGGSPVQSSIIRDRMLQLRKAHPDTKVWAVGEDMLTSGAYFIAMGAPKVCVNRSTITGSIGVRQDSWGLDRVIDKLGIERRVFTAGESKNRMDPFKPLAPEDIAHTREMLSAIHSHFKDVVREGRGDRLKAPEDQLFTGDYWTGDQAVKLGLVDRLCDLQQILADEFHVKDAKDFTPNPSFFQAISGAVGAEVAARFTEEAGLPKWLPAGW